MRTMLRLTVVFLAGCTNYTEFYHTPPLTSRSLASEGAASCENVEPWDDARAWEVAVDVVGDTTGEPPPMLAKRHSAAWPFEEWEGGMWTPDQCEYEGRVTRVIWLHLPHANRHPYMRAHEAVHELMFRADGNADVSHDSSLWAVMEGEYGL